MHDAIPSSDPLRSERFEIRGRLGGGAFGEVFRAYDRQLKTIVALKVLHRVEPAALYHFKKEFRALVGVHHRNLVELYELLSAGDRWFFTMELVEGRDLLGYAGLDATRSTLAMGIAPSAEPAPDEGPLRRLRGALKQLASGLSALHQAGRLHRDIKPSNVKVTPEGRLVLLDFGMVKVLATPEADETSAGELIGTPAYMSPEQALGAPLTEASDWYAVGSVLFQALTGERPFDGGLVEIIRAKQEREPIDPRDVDPRLPADLSMLCRELMSRDPARRPSGDEVLERLGGSIGASTAGLEPPRAEEIPFVGREHELSALESTFDRTRQGKAVAVFVRGSSGLGKTALVDRFLARLRRRHPEAVVLSSRCYERESAPYKGLDPLVDALSGYLKQLPEAEAEAMVPSSVWSLVRLFPALERVPAVRQAGREALERLDPHEQRRQARRALRELLRRLAARHPTVLTIDDLQWSDLDSANLLAHVLDPPDPPPVLLVTCDRRDGSEEHTPLYRLLASMHPADPTEVHELEVDRLSFQETCELGRSLFSGSRVPQMLLRSLARESGGSPFFMAELVRYARSESERGAGEESDTSIPSLSARGIPLENLIWNRLERLPPAARRLIDVVAVAGRPVTREVAIEAADLGSEAQAALSELLARSLICLRGDRQQELETYHDRIRVTSLQGLDPVGLAGLHRRLATALQATGRADAETLAMHFHEAGDRERAAELAVTAARRAVRALAFDRAVGLYQLALELVLEDDAERHVLQVALADALAKVGRCPEAADAYFAAAATAGGTEALDLERRAAVQLLFSGRARDAASTIRRLLRSAGTRLPHTMPGVLISLLSRQLFLRLRGLGFRQREVDSVPSEELFRIDACWSGAGIAIEPLRWMDLGIRHLLLALDAGEPRRIVRALLQQVFFLARGGRKTRRRSTELIQLASRLAKRLDDPYCVGLASYAAGLAAYFEGRWQRAGELFERAEAGLRVGLVDWELTWVIFWRMEILCWRGHLRELLDRLPSALKEVSERGNLLLETMLRGRVAWVTRLAADQPEEAGEELGRAERLLTPDLAFFRPFQLAGRVEVALYRDDCRAAWTAVEQAWPTLERYSLLSVQLDDTQFRHLRCRAALASAVDAGISASGRFVGLIKKDLRRIEAHRLAWGDPLAQLLRAGLESLCEGKEAAFDHLAAAEAGFESAGMELYAAVSMRRRGQLLKDAGGARLIREADRWMSEQGIRDPARMAGVLAPGAWESPPA